MTEQAKGPKVKRVRKREEIVEEYPKKRKRGRPKGSFNKKNKAGIKPDARVKEDEIIQFDYKGIKMSIKERDERMRLEYIRGLTIAEISYRYGVSEPRLKKICADQKWVQAKKEFENHRQLVTDNTLTQMYAGFKVNVNIKYHAAWEKLMNIVEMCLNYPDVYLMTKEGQIRWGALDVLSNLIDRAQKGQERANGNLPEEIRYKLEVEKEKITLLRAKMGEGEAEEELKDNFVDALDKAAKSVWAEFEKATGAYIEDTAERATK